MNLNYGISFFMGTVIKR